MLRLLRRWRVESDGMEMLEWAIVGLLFALATAGAFAAPSSAVRDALVELGSFVAALGS